MVRTCGRESSASLFIIRLFLVLSLIVSGTAASIASETKYQVVREQNIMVAMSDGVKLSTDVIRPQPAGRFPTILYRTPYDKDDGEEFTPLAELGYVVVVQLCRGRLPSEGEWKPFFHEAADGNDTINWVVAQPWSDGRVVSAGGSYAALDQWLAATKHNPHLRGMITKVSPSNFYRDLSYPGGAFSQGGLQMWSYFTFGGKLSPPASAPVPWDKVFTHLPVVNGLSLQDRDVSYFQEWIAHPSDDSYWRRIKFDDLYSTFDLPAIHITGWFDAFQSSTIRNFEGMHHQAPASAREKQLLIVGPWGHNSFGRKTGDVDFGDEAKPSLFPVITAWLDNVLNRTDNGFFAKPVRVFTMGENTWHEYENWPEPGSQRLRYFIHSTGASNGLEGSGTLTTAVPGSQEKPDHYVYDPLDPVPTQGGGNCCWPKIVPWGPLDQRDVERRQDVLVYTSPELSSDVRIDGPIVAKLWISSSAVDTDFTVKLVDVFPDGFAMNLSDGILRARYRDSFEKPALLKPGKRYAMTIDVGNTSNLFKTGHRIRVEIASSNFPHFSRNTNTGSNPEKETRMVRANQTIFHDAKHPSYIELYSLP